MQNTINNIKTDSMKTVKAFTQKLKAGMVVLGLTFFCSNAAIAHNGNSTGLDEAEKQIKSHMKLETPLAQVHQTQKVEVVFTTGENGTVNFVLAKTENQTAKSEIEKQFSKLNFQSLKANVAYSIIINFKTL